MVLGGSQSLLLAPVSKGGIQFPTTLLRKRRTGQARLGRGLLAGVDVCIGQHSESMVAERATLQELPQLPLLFQDRRLPRATPPIRLVFPLQQVREQDD